MLNKEPRLALKSKPRGVTPLADRYIFDQLRPAGHHTDSQYRAFRSHTSGPIYRRGYAPQQ
jgi:hypothetical protein